MTAIGAVQHRWVVVVVCLALLAGGVACSAQAVDSQDTTAPSLGPLPTADAPALPVTITDALGRQVTVTDVGRIVPLWGSLSEVVFALGLGDKVVGRDISATFAEVADLPVVTRGHDVSAESVLSLRPSLVLATPDTGPPEAIDHLRNVGVPVVVLENPTTVEGIGERIRALGRALGVPEAGERVAAEAEAALADVAAEVPTDAPRPRVAFLYLRGHAGVYLIAGPGSGADSMIDAAGGIDAGTAIGLDRSFTPITSEALITAAPEVLLVTTTGLESVGGIDGLVTIPGIAQTPAGRDRRVIAVEDGLLFGFGSRTAEALDLIIDQLHPSPAGSLR